MTVAGRLAPAAGDAQLVHQRMELPRIAITMGDPAGIGPELCCRIANDAELARRGRLTVFGCPRLLQRVAQVTGLPAPPTIRSCSAASDIVPGQISAAAGAAALAAVEAGIDACLAGEADALVTAPIHKQAIAAAGCPHPGHTELLAERCGCDDVAMLLSGAGLQVALVTIHQSLVSVAGALCSSEIIRVGRLLVAGLRRLGRPAPRIAVLGFNPHAGDGGRFGDEEARIVAPAIAALRAEGIDADGPLPPDTAFAPAIRRRYDGHLCLYHDQGLIPFKALAFDAGVNITLGLPIVRTSPDHGTAFDIAWQGRAAASSMRAAVTAAIAMATDPSPGVA